MVSEMTIDNEKLKLLANTIRGLAMDAVERANSGHPGMPMGTADMASVLWAHHLRFNPKDPGWMGRDRFVLSAGHGSMLLYSLLHLFGYGLSKSELENFRQWQSLTPGHPEYGLTSGVETTTGPLGQGFANGVGMAIGAKAMQARYDQKLFDYNIYGIVSDGDLMEGVANEAASLAGHLGLGNLIYLYDDNKISIGGHTDVCYTEDVSKKYEALGWHVQSIDGHDYEAVNAALIAAKSEKAKPSIIIARTTIAKGSPNKANTADSHGAPLGAEEVRLSKQELGCPTDQSFYVPEEVGVYCCQLMEQRVSDYDQWKSSFAKWSSSNAELVESFKQQCSAEISASLKKELIAFAEGVTADTATRALSGQALQILAANMPGLIGGSADLEPSNKTLIKGSPDVTREDFSGKNLRFGVREHAMGAISNGLAYSKNWIPYTATFLVFSDYMRPAMRLAALSHLQTFFIFTHDSFWVGEDGPTHQPIEHCMSIRLMPNMYLYRPADALEVALCYYAGMTRKNAPSTFLFTRQNVPVLKRDSNCTPDDILKGGYVVSGSDCSDLVLVATGSEVGIMQDVSEALSKKGISARVVSIPCWELFFEQDQEYQNSVIPAEARKVSLEAGVTAGWERVVGEKGLALGLDHYGASAPGEVLAEKFGFTAEAVLAKMEHWL
ncbi:MAG: transketolase [Deltaproteobacteria bacterium]|nr:transketolase [Deltaproteobacteria bacterium]